MKTYPIRIYHASWSVCGLEFSKKEVVKHALRELEYHFWLLDRLGIGKEGIVVVHVGGIYDNKKESLKRFKSVIRSNSWLLERLAAENDGRYYTVEDLLLADFSLPIVYDYYHHSLNPSIFDPREVLESWKDRVPGFHLSSRPRGKYRFGEHGEWINLKDFIDFLEQFRNNRIDLILEAKGKEKAVKKLIEEICKFKKLDSKL
ncbi:MAG: hypothetical protein ABDH49_08250 [Candidatus Hydrothermales bacterium]